MTQLTLLAPSQTFGDLLTTTNNGQGFTTNLEQLQDGLGQASPISIATDKVNFDRTAGQLIMFDTVPMTATSGGINSMCEENPICLGVGAITLPFGTMVQRPLVPENGMIRFNTTSNRYEGFDVAAWVNFGLGDGNITGPVISTDTAVVRWGNATGTLTLNSGVLISDANIMTGLDGIDCNGVLNVDGITSSDNILLNANLYIFASSLLSFYDFANDFNVTFRAPHALAQDSIYTLPSAPPPGPGYFLTSDNLGNLTWAIPA
jgi:hypothetical protein